MGENPPNTRITSPEREASLNALTGLTSPRTYQADFRRSHQRAFSVRQYPYARANGPHEVRSVPPPLFVHRGLARGAARLGAPGLAGGTSGLLEPPAS